jgi:hypothetical protein
VIIPPPTGGVTIFFNFGGRNSVKGKKERK